MAAPVALQAGSSASQGKAVPSSPSLVTSVLDINVAGIASFDGYGSAGNTVLSNVLPANAHIIGIGWVTTQTATAPSWLSEMVVSFESTSTFAVQLTPAVGDDFPGTSNYTSGGIVDLVGLALDFNLDADGLLKMQFFESFNDFANAVDGRWDAGTISIRYEFNGTSVPEPATLALVVFALAGVAAGRRRRS